MRHARNGGSILVVAVVLMAVLSGCAAWSADSPAGDGVTDPEDGPEAADGTNDEGGDDEREEVVDEDAANDDPRNSGSAADDESSDGGTEPEEGGNGSTVGEDDVTDANAGTPDDDGSNADDGTSEDGDADGDGTEADTDREGDDGTEADESPRAYDARQFTFVYIAYEDDEERPPNSAVLLNGHERSIDLSGWTVTTTEGGEYAFPEDTVIESDGTIAVRFGPDELTRDGGTLALIDAQGNVVIEDEYDG